MKGSFILCFCLVSLLQVHEGVTQHMMRYDPDRPVICYQSDENLPDHVAISEHFRRIRQSASGRLKTANFEVEYINFPADNLAKTAFQYAIEIWESELISSVPIRVRAEWRDLDAGVLGQALWGSAYANFGGEQHMNTFYPVALAEKISGRDLNHVTEADVVASFNRNVSWYLGTDGLTPAGKMDLVTIVLHEIAHGLGFTDTYSVAEGAGTVGLPSGEASVPFVFDVFVEDGSSKNLLHDFEIPSAGLASALQNDNLFFDGPLSATALNGVKPELFAPAEFDDGSSISHLDETVFSGTQDANRLMTPQIAFAESIHDPGDLLLGMLGDLGWIYTYIDHVPLNDTERKDGQPYVVTATIRSDNGYDPGAVKLHYTTDGANFTTVNMSSTGAANEFEASLPGTTVNRAYAYYISVVDQDNSTFTRPGKLQDPGSPPEQGTHFINIGPDADPPDIIHEPVTYIFDYTEHLEITVEVTDNQGVGEVVLEYVVDDGVAQTAMMTQVSGTDVYTASVALSGLRIGDIITYRIIATDLASAVNISTLPADGFFEITVTGALPAQDSYVNDFNETSSDFFGNSFRIEVPSGFENRAIHSDHPYHNGSGPNDESNYIYQLQIPIRLSSDNPYMRFDEIVLVEPGDAGSEFGSSDFFDYVVVEGSADDGVSWHPLVDGYDSRDNSVWLSRYNSELLDDNSQASGDPGLYRTRTIDMLANGTFFSGDEILIRFRLFADQLAHGWGWAIDNLFIQSPVTAVEGPASAAFSVYPVPARDILYVVSSSNYESLAVEITDLQGKVFYAEILHPDNVTKFEAAIDVRFLNEGLYIIKARTKDKTSVRKFVKTR